MNSGEIVDEDLLSPELGRLIDAAKAAAAASAAAATVSRAEGWAVLCAGGSIYAGPDLGAILATARAEDQTPAHVEEGAEPAATPPVAAAFAVFGEAEETVLPDEEAWKVLRGTDPELPVVVKYLGRWVVLPLSEVAQA